MKKQALIIIDVQNEMFKEENPVFHHKQLLIQLETLLKNARCHNVPIFYIQHNAPKGKALEQGTHAWEIHEAIAPTNQDYIIQKTTPDAFFQTNFQEQLTKLEIEHLILAGIQTEICVDTTCRRAYSLGYESTLVTDAHSTWNSSDLTAQQIIQHHNQVLRWFAHTEITNNIQFT